MTEIQEKYFNRFEKIMDDMREDEKLSDEEWTELMRKFLYYIKNT